MVRDVLSTEAPGGRDFLSASLLFMMVSRTQQFSRRPRRPPPSHHAVFALLWLDSPSASALRAALEEAGPDSAVVVVTVPPHRVSRPRIHSWSPAASSNRVDRLQSLGDPDHGAHSRRRESEARVSSRVSIPLRCASRHATWRCRRFRRFVPSSRKWRPTMSSGHAPVRLGVETPLVPGPISPT